MRTITLFRGIAVPENQASSCIDDIKINGLSKNEFRSYDSIYLADKRGAEYYAVKHHFNKNNNASILNYCRFEY